MTAARILVVDDKEGMREGCREVLEARGHLVEVAEDGLEGLNKAQSNSYDLVLIDVKMPKIDGLDLLRQVKESDPDVECVVITGYATLELAVQATKLGAYDFLAKPFMPRELLAVVSRALERRRLTLEARRLREEAARNLLEIAAEKSRLRTIINCMRDGVLVTNREGRVVLANPAAQSLLAEPGEELYGRRCSECVADDGLLEIIAQALSAEAEQPKMHSRELTLGPNAETVVMANVAPVSEDRGEPVGCIVVLHDITRLKELERVKEQFVRMVAHELRAPVAAIAQYLDALRTTLPSGDLRRQDRMLGRCQDRALGLLDLIDDLLRISAIEAGRVARRIERVDAGECVREAVEFFRPQAEARGLKLRTRLEPSLPAILADRSDLSTVLTNLLSNAVKYNREGGWIEVSAQPVGAGVLVEVADGGTGIPEAELPNLFREFHRVKTRENEGIVGTGLGLSIVRRVVEAHHGQVRVRSKYGEGSVFGVWFPSPSATQPPEHEGPGLAEQPARG